MLLPVILSGGSGSRLWPLSREGYPKQFLPLFGDEHSLFQGTLKRVGDLPQAQPPLVVSNDAHRFLVAEQARAFGTALSGILLEPIGRNTAPAIALAALWAQGRDLDPLLLLLPSDHVIADQAAFEQAIAVAMREAEAGALVTFGIQPTRPETGYGYIRAGLKTPTEAAEGNASGYHVDAFVEKPDAETAAGYLAEGGYYWNSGIFLFRASKLLAALETHAPEILTACTAALAGRQEDLDFCRLDAGAFARCPSDSIDYAVMEKTDAAVVVPMDAGWSDLGAWPAVWEAMERDAQGNARHGDVMLENCRDCHAHAEHRLLAMLGVEDLMVVETADAILIAHRDHAQDVKKIVSSLKAQGRGEAEQHRQVYRPWGAFDAIDADERFQVKRITVKPGERLSTQMHHHRAEHWVVVKGTARVTIDEQSRLVTENESVYIPIGSVHSLENPGKVPLELIEVQTGSYLGEDDILRFEDRYGRE